MISRLALYAALLLLSACTKPIDLTLDSSEPALVVEGYVTSDTTPYFVRVTQTQDYFTTNSFRGVTDAVVVLTAHLPGGDRIDTLGLLNRPNEDSSGLAGLYRTRQHWRALPGVRYDLQVVAMGRDVRASSWMPAQVRIDSITYRYRDDVADPSYYLTIYAPEPDTLGNCYRIVGYVNGVRLGGVRDYIISDDRLFNGVYVRREMPFSFAPGDTATIELWSIPRAQLDFYTTMINQMFTGGPVAPPGDNVVTNMPKGVYGFFGAYGLDSRTLILPKE